MPIAFRKDFTKAKLPYSMIYSHVFNVAASQSSDFVFAMSDYVDDNAIAPSVILATPFWNATLGQSRKDISIETYTELVTVNSTPVYKGHIIVTNNSADYVGDLEVAFSIISATGSNG